MCNERGVLYVSEHKAMLGKAIAVRINPRGSEGLLGPVIPQSIGVEI
jgi:hypothetical protein